MSRALPLHAVDARSTAGRWISQALKRDFDSVLAEPVPNDLLRLLATPPA